MSANDILIGIGIGVVTTALTTGVTFYIKDYLQDRSKYKKFKEKLEQIAGKNAEVMIPTIGKVKIVEINKQGIVVQNELSKTFIPIDKIFQTEVSLPVENYDKIEKEIATKKTKEMFELIMPLMMNSMKEMIVKEFSSGDSEVNAVVALQVKTQLKEQGYTVIDKEGEKTPTFKQITDHFSKKNNIEKSQEK